MRAAFDHISDPNDPAWDGYADEVRIDSRRVRLQRTIGIAVCALAVLAGIGVAVAALRGNATSERAAPARSAVAPAPAERIGSVPMTDEGVITAAAAAGGEASAHEEPVVAGSGWAPAEATISPEERYPHLTGDLAGLRPSLVATLNRLAARLGRKIEVVSGWRTHHEQKELYGMYQNGTGNLAAVPGTSMHETGDAADVYIDGVALADVPGAKDVAASFGLHFPVPGEAWHIEPR